MKHCIYCGAEMPDEAKFCGVCGKPFSGEQLQQLTVTQQVVASQQVQQQPNMVIIQQQSNSIGTVGFVFSILSFILFVLIVIFDLKLFEFITVCVIVALVGYFCSMVGIYRKPNGLAIAGGKLVFAETICCLILNFDGFKNLGDLLLLQIPAIVFFILAARQGKREKRSNNKQLGTN